MFAALVAVAFALKVPSALARFRLCPDAIAYLNIAQNLAAGEGFTSTLKLTYFAPSSVTHSALSDWPPLYPLFAGAFVRFGCGEVSLQAINALLTAIAAGLVFLIGQRLFNRRAGLVAGAFAAIAPNLFRAGITALSDALGLVFALAAVLAAITADGRPSRWLVAGATTGAACFARYPCLVLIPAFASHLLIRREQRSAIACALGLVLVAGPFVAWKWAVDGSPAHCAQILHYAAPSFRQVMWEGSRGATGLDWCYALHHLPSVGPAIANNLRSYTLDLLGVRGLFLLCTGLVLAGSPRMTAERRLVISIAGMSFAVCVLTWAIPPVRGSRLLLLPYCLTLPICATGLSQALRKGTRARRLIAAAACMATAAAYLWGCITAAGSTAGQFTPASVDAARQAVRSLEPGTNVASNNPWMVSYATGYPAALLPHNLDERELARFIQQHDIGAMVVFKGRSYGQNAYEGIPKTIPHIVQKLPTIHSPRITPRKNGRTRT